LEERRATGARHLGRARRWKIGLARKPQEAKAFYATIVVATLVGTGISFSSIAAIKALFWSAVINGVVAAPVMTVMMLMTANKSIMGRFEIHGYLKYVGWIEKDENASTFTS
jgi:Mn2+/Fe2+ NRAMP family transporter